MSPTEAPCKPAYAASHAAAGELLVADIGGSQLRLARYLGGSACELISTQPTPTQDWADFCAALCTAVKGVARRTRGLSISIAGVVVPDTGQVVAANIPCIRGRPLAQELASLLGMPVQVSNDADCAALAEARVGVGQGHEVVFGAVLGTGVGGGLVVRGQLVQGAGGLCGEWGHGPSINEATLLNGAGQRVHLPRFRCGCGLSGCADTVGGARGLERLHLALNGGAARSSHQIVNDWQAGDRAASATVAAYVELLSGPLALVVNVTGASVVPVCGGLSRSAELISTLDAAVRRQILRRSRNDSNDSDQALLRPSVLNDQAGLIGAAFAFEHGAAEVRA